VSTWPKNLREEIAHRIERNRVVAYAIASPAGEVRRALPPDREEDRGRATWISQIPGLEQAVVVEDTGALAVLTLREKYPSLKVDPKDTERVLATDIWLRERFPGRRIARADYVLLSEGLDRLSGSHPTTERDAGRLYRWLEEQAGDQWAMVSPASNKP
jgi:hypothetical protein